MKILIFIFSVLVAASTRAQEKWIQDLEVFAGTGLISNTGSGSYLAYKDTKPSFSFGVGANHYFSRVFDLNVRVGYERKGFKYSEFYYDPYLQENRSMQIDRSVDCFSVQLLPTFKVGKQRTLRLGIGPYFSIPYHTIESVKQFDQSGNLIAQGGSNSTRPSHDVGNDLGLTGFIGYTLRIGTFEEISIQLMSSHGVVAYAKASGGDVRNVINGVVLSYRYKRKIFRGK